MSDSNLPIKVLMADVKDESFRVIIADDDFQMARRLADFLNGKGFQAIAVSNGKDAKTEILTFKPRFVLANLTLPDGNALQIIDYIRTEPKLRSASSSMHVIVLSGHNTAENVKLAINQGAKDYVVKPFRFEDMVKRLVFHSRNFRGLGEVAAKDVNKFDEVGLMHHLTVLVLRQALGSGRLEDILYNLTKMVTMRVIGVRCSIIHCLDQKTGFVVTSNDDRKASGIQLDLYKYPEVLHVLNTQKLIAIENIDDTLEMRHIKDQLSDIVFNSMIVCPVSRRGEAFGVLSLRMSPDKKHISDNEIRFMEIVSHIVSLVLGSETHKMSDNYWLHRDRTPSVAAFPSKK